MSLFSLYEHDDIGGRRLIEFAVKMTEADASARNRELVATMRRWYPVKATPSDVHARTTVGAAFVEPSRNGERLTILLTEFLHGRVGGAGTSTDLHEQAEAVARNLAQVILNRFNVTERK